jgi:branched-chain amino acid transport system ATP-binding protein
MLAIAQALAAQPRVLLLDEPSAGLAPSVVEAVFDRVAQLRDAGLTILLVEQLAERALAIADHVTVMDNGVIVRDGPPSGFADRGSLEEAYFGLAASEEPAPASDTPDASRRRGPGHPDVPRTREDQS